MRRAKKPEKTPWTVSTARQNLPALLAASAKEPQAIYRHKNLVAAVLSPDALAELSQARKATLGSAFQRLRQICQEDGYDLVVAARSDRTNAFAPDGK